MRRVVLFCLFTCIPAWSQTSTGSIRGTITDPTDASVGVCNLSVGIELVTGIIE